MGRYDYKMTKTDKKMWAILVPILIIGGIWLAIHNREVRASVKSDGIETIGIVVNKTVTRRNHRVYFEFEYDGIVFRNSRGHLNRQLFHSVVVGGRYKVMFLPENPGRDAFIFLDRPVID